MSTYNPTVNQGIDLIFTVTWTDSSNNPINITGYSVQMQVRSQVDNSLVLGLSVGSGITLTNPTGGVATFQITGAQTAAIGVGIYDYGIKAVSSGGINYDWTDGTITIAHARVK